MKKFVVFSVLALALFAFPAAAQGEDIVVAPGVAALSSSGMDGIAGDIPFMSSVPCGMPATVTVSDYCLPSWCKPLKMNFDSVDQGNQVAISGSPPFLFSRRAYATNDFNLDKTQSACPCTCSLYNIEQINSGNQIAIAFGAATSDNNINIKTCQQ